MRSLAGRLTTVYALSATVSSAALLTLGYGLLQSKMVHNLDTLIATDAGRINTHLHPDDPSRDPAVLETRLRRTTDNSAALFVTEIRDASGRPLFLSRNLHGRPLILPAGADAIGEGVSILHAGGQSLRVRRYPGPLGMQVLIGTPTDSVDDMMQSYIEVAVMIAVIMLIASTSFGFLISQLALRPLRSIAETTKRITSDNLAERIAVQKVDDEVGDLARLLNEMFERIEASFRQIRRFTADASHELKTPLSLIRLHAERLLSSGDLDATQERSVTAQLEEVLHLTAMIEDLLILSRTDSRTLPLDIAPRRPADFVESFREDAIALADDGGVSVEIVHRGDGDVPFDAKWLRHVLLNLLTNAIRATRERAGGTIEILSRQGPRGWTMEVADRGAGLRQEDRERIFDRFVTKNEGGTGLGLAICRSIVALHGGMIGNRPRDDGPGTIFWVSLPI